MGSGWHHLNAVYEPCDQKVDVSVCGKQSPEQQLSGTNVSFKFRWRSFEGIRGAWRKQKSARGTEFRGILRFILVAQHLNIPAWLHADRVNPLNPHWVKREAAPLKREIRLPLFSENDSWGNGVYLCGLRHVFIRTLFASSNLPWLQWEAQCDLGSEGSGQQWKQRRLKQDFSISGWKKKYVSGHFPLPCGDTCLVIPAERYWSAPNTSGFNSLYLSSSGCWWSIKRKGFARDLTLAALTLKRRQNNQLDRP